MVIPRWNRTSWGQLHPAPSNELVTFGVRYSGLLRHIVRLVITDVYNLTVEGARSSGMLVTIDNITLRHNAKTTIEFLQS